MDVIPPLPELQAWGSLAITLGIGLLIGVERERRKGTGTHRHFAGVRTFALVGVLGCAVELLALPLLTAMAALFVGALCVISHLKDQSKDPGATTEIGLFLTFVLGALSVSHQALAAAGGVTVASLLLARTSLQQFSTQVLTETELRDAMLLAGAALIVLPLTPDHPLPGMSYVNLRWVWSLVVLIMGVQALGHVGLRLMGARLGLPLSGLVAGFISSTATIATLGGRVAKSPELMVGAVSAAWFSSVSTGVQVLLIAATLDPASLKILWPSMLAAIAVSASLGLVVMLKETEMASEAPSRGHAFSLWQSAGLALLLTATSALVSWAQDFWGTAVSMGAVALAGFGDMHAASAAVISLYGKQLADAHFLQLAVLMAFTTNTFSKCVAACAAGGRTFGGAVSLGLILICLAAWVPYLLHVL